MSSPAIVNQDVLRIDLPDRPTIAAPVRAHVVVTGPSGTGKSALCLLIAGVSDETKLEAHVQIFGNPLDKIPFDERARRIGFVPSDPFLAFTGLKRTLLGELELVQRLVTTASTSGSSFLKHVVTRLDLADYLHRDPFTLSGGEAVRAALAMALIKRPLLLVLDQVHEQLDPAALTHIYTVIAELLPAISLVFEARSRGMPTSTAAQQDLPAIYAHRWHVDLRSHCSGEAAPDYIPAAPLRAQMLSENTEGARLPLLLIEGLTHCYPSSGFSLGPINLRLAAGDRIALVGPNGSGKSTLLKCLALLERPNFTRMEIFGANRSAHTPPSTRQAHRWATHALYCFQRPEDQLYLSSVREELAETSRRLGVVSTYDEAIQFAKLLGIEPYLDRSPYDIPRSFRRLIPIAGAIAVNPPLLLLDEPTVGLDDVQVSHLIQLLNERRHAGATIFISHDQEFIEAVATRRLDIREF